MTESTNQVLPVSLESEMRESYLAYAMSVIVGRALPDVRDGLKPVHRRVLYAMNVLNNDWNKPYKKSARVVGDVIGKYHPHGDSAVYDTIVRMAQDFSLRYPLVDGQGNFGSIDGDAAAAMRYTEIRMERIAHDLMADLDKETVNFSDNYDGTEIIPDVFPTQIPNLLVNGSSGIAVGMATNIPPHNLGEVIDASLALLDNEDISIDELMEYVTGPDFPTAAIINGKAGIIEAYKTGRGRIYMRARAEIIEDAKTGRQTIIVTEIPYQLNKARLIEKIAELVKDKKIEGISELRDESDKDGLRIVIELRRGEVGEVVLNNLYAQTQMQAVFGINMVALVDGEPKLLNLKEILEAFLRHRREVVTRRTIYLLRKAREKGHILEGLAVALANIDEVIQLIKESPSSAEAKEKLLSRSWQSSSVLAMLEASGADTCRPEELPEEFGLKGEEYYLSPAQAQAILDLRLHRLTGLEHEKLINDYKELLKQIADFLEILGSETRLFEVLREEMNQVRDSYADPRRTEIVGSQLDLTMEDLITQEDRVVTISRSGYAKSQPLTDYQAQRRGGMGKAAASVKDEDVVEHLLIANSHDTLLCFSSFGKVYWIRVFNIPIASRTSRGRPLVNILPLEEGEQITSMLPVNDYEAGHFIVMATLRGTIKKTPLENFSRPRSVGLRAIELDEGDRLIGTALTNGEREIMLLSSSGKAIRFKESDVRAMGRTARGVRGIKLSDDHEMISLIIPDDEKQVLTVSEYGYGKRTSTSEFPVYGRGGQGVIAMQTSERNGSLVGAVQVEDGDQIMLISNKGTLVRTRVDEISILSRNTQGVRLIKLKKDETLVGIEQVADADDADLDDELLDGDAPETGDSDE
jgi:DNA gyrase subunit A